MNQPDPLDELLRRWADGVEADPNRLETLRGRIVARAKAPPAIEHEAGDGGVFVLSRRGWLYAAACAATLLAAAVWWQCGSARQPASGDQNVLAGATITEEDVRVGRQVFAEMERLFAPGLAWVADSGGEMGVGVEPDARRPAAAGPPVMVRLALMSRSARSAGWECRWTMQVLLRSEETAQVAPAPGSARPVTLWAFPVEGGKVALDARVSIAAGTRGLAGEALVSDGRPAEVLAVNSDGTEYRLVGTVRVLRPPAGTGRVNVEQQG